MDGEKLMDSQYPSVEDFQETFANICHELGKVVVGQQKPIRYLLTAIFAGGHVLLKGFPGLGRTLIVKSLSDVMDLSYGRIQFTPDLLPTDITGAEVLEHEDKGAGRHFHFFKGPVFANLVLADEVNRSPARTQAALLEVMQEKQVSVGGQTYFLPKPFILIATQNTLDSEGVFALGEAQVDRFLGMIEQDFPSKEEEKAIVCRTTGIYHAEMQNAVNPEKILLMQKLAREVPVVPSVKEFALNIVRASRGGAPYFERVIRLGASPRATQALILMGKVTALSKGRFHVRMQDIIDSAVPVLSHRILLDFRAKAEGVTTAEIIQKLVNYARNVSKPRVSMWTRELLKL